MKSEDRIIQASILTGITEMMLGIIMSFTGWHVWYYDNFHFFGVLGIGMFMYGCYHGVLKWKQK